MLQVCGLCSAPMNEVVSGVSAVLSNKPVIRQNQLRSSVIVPDQAQGTRQAMGVCLLFCSA